MEAVSPTGIRWFLADVVQRVKKASGKSVYFLILLRIPGLIAYRWITWHAQLMLMK